ncbi:glycosyltransferase family 4 protein [Corynebacterium breve]|uniref:Glycosyltransferase family 4 protein n=1 Tax=Corynebacterium breve TaxID=3049799 RepID=A0ABY8VCV5_9CORY|nr:glycosyltransferase family 4 protein [Corynebacterium breve]WIM67494.1 glycosyltransferase family 4 protein [Corynebacterium breve]
MKILLMCWRDLTHPQGGGSERYLERVGEYLAAQGHQIIYRTASHTDAPRTSVRNGIKYERVGGKFTVYPWGLFAVLRHRPDIVIDTQNGIPFFAKLVTKKPVILLTHHCHREQWPVAGPVLARLGWWLESVLAPRVYRGSQYVTVSEASADDLIVLGVNEAEIQIIENGVDPLPEKTPLLVDDGLIHLVTLSRLVPHKHIEDAMDTVASLDGVVLDVIGSGWWEDQLRAYAAPLGDKVVFHGQVTEDYKHALLQRADIHLMPSAKEGWGLAVIEAAQHGVPSIGYRTAGGLCDSIRDGETGVLVDTRGQLVHATRELIEDPERRRILGENARKWATQFSWEKTGARFAELIDDVVARQKMHDQ